MELINMLRVVRRWLWLIVAMVVVVQLALWLGMRAAGPSYTATLRLQISTPQRGEVALFDEYRSIALRDEITVATNNFIELLLSDEVSERTTSQLSLTGKDADYKIEAKPINDSDFVDVAITARRPDLAAEIANTQVGTAIAYYGELNAQATRAEMALVGEQLQVAENELQSAEKTLSDFRSRNGIFSLESQLATQQKLLEQLQLKRDERLLAANTTVATTAITTTTVITTTIISPIGEIEQLIAERQQELDRLSSLAPQYNILAQKVEQAGSAYQHLLSKYGEAEVKVTAVQAANFIQVIKPGYAPAEPDSNWPMLAALALIGSLGLGVVLAFLFQYIYPYVPAFQTAQGAAPAGKQQTPAPGGQAKLPSMPSWRLRQNQ